MAENYYDQRAEIAIGGAGVIGQILKNRFHAQQAQDFVSNELSQFQQATAAFTQGLGTIEEPDMMGQAFLDWKTNTFMPFVTQAAVRYSGNPQIMTIVQEVSKANMEGLDQFMNFRKEGREQAESEAKVGLLGAQTSEANATTGLRGAQTREADARAALLRRQAAAVGAEKGPKWVIPPDAPPAVQRMFARQMPQDRAEALDNQTVEKAALSIIRQNNGKPRPDGLIWGEPKPEGVTPDIQVAADLFKDSPYYEMTIEGGRISSMLGQGALFQHQGYYDPAMGFLVGEGGPALPEEYSGKLMGNQDFATTLSVMMGVPKKQVAGTFSTGSVNEFIQNDLAEMNDPAELGPSFQSLFRDSINQNEFGKIKTFDGQEVKNYADLVAQLSRIYEDRILNNKVANNSGSANTRNQVRQLGRAAIQRFAPLVAQRVGIELPPRQKRSFLDAIGGKELKLSLGLGGTPRPAPSSTSEPPPDTVVIEPTGLTKRAPRRTGPGAKLK